MNVSVKVKFFNIFRKIFQAPFLEQWLVNQTQGKSVNHFISKFVPNAYQYKSPSNRTFVREGITLSVDISDYIGHYYFYGFQDESIEKLYALCKIDSIVFDIGTNIGFTALRFARKAKAGSVIGFEPDPYNYSCCIRNLELNSLRNIKIFNTGLGNEKGMHQMELRTPSNRGGNRINNKAVNGYKVQVNKLDDFLNDLKVERVDLIKIDVEGYELKVLMGAEKIIKVFKPILFIEVDDNNLKDQGDSAQALLYFLKNAGYDNIIQADTSRVVDVHTDFSDCHFDIIVR